MWVNVFLVYLQDRCPDFWRMFFIMKNLKTIIIAFTAVFLSAGLSSLKSFAVEPQGYVSYSLPSTTISITVDAVQENFYAGPYAKFATKYLGIDARTSDSVGYRIERVSMAPYVEADAKERFLLPMNSSDSAKRMLALSSSGLVSFENAEIGNEKIWKFPRANAADFSDKGVNSNLKSESATLVGARKKDVFNSVQQEMTIAKSLEQKAKETADMILDLRKTRIQIVTGDTDATYSGEAMGAVLSELDKLEKEYLSLFIGYTDYNFQRANFDIVPDKGNDTQMLVAFRLSDSDGLKPSTEQAGRPIVMQIIPEKIDEGDYPTDKSLVKAIEKNSSKYNYIHYRIPSTCMVNILEGTKLLLQSRLPIYQMGIESTMPVEKIK